MALVSLVIILFLLFGSNPNFESRIFVTELMPAFVPSSVIISPILTGQSLTISYSDYKREKLAK